MNNLLTIVIYSGDSAEWVWPSWKHYWKKYWKTAGYVKVLFVSEFKFLNMRGTASYLTQLKGQEHWATGLIKAISEQVTTPYIIFGHEDYFLTGNMYESDLLEVAFVMERRDLVKIKLFHNPDTKLAREENPIDSDGLYFYDKHRDYLNSFQPSMWNTAFFKGNLREGENSWQSEVWGGQRIFENYVSLYAHSLHLFPYVETVWKGEKRPGYEGYFLGEGQQ